MAEAEQPSGRMTHRFDGQGGVRIGAFAGGVEAFGAKPALPAADREGYDHSIADSKIADFATEFDHRAHVFVAQDVSALHCGLITIQQMQVRATDRACGNFDNGVPRMFDLRIRDAIDTNVAMAVPA